ncbi:hypothetical protein VN12_03620 [Pirellula sp. SH-Sr6A]|uniref:hypothetical protein n=1 Tax=Pirellula sp. SH-Sr6A TaxID=1632865 RepID=UPI00078BF4AA|nr:hypothetical protein [Pirellula sp. SH-Sr6A]AMV31181.1 hypothetical protein VN12_03620 [Pirellula sp. SH-Sr6A]
MSQRFPESTLRLVPASFPVLLGTLLLLGTGCFGSSFASKRWGGSQFGQGDINRQKDRAVYFDPYPLNDIGPEVVGGRPREFAHPLPEAKRNELNRIIPNQQFYPVGP